MSNAILKELRPDGILILTINRPEAYNALNKAFFDTMDSILDEIYTNDAIRSIILTGSGEKAFAAGADIKEFSSFNKETGKINVIKKDVDNTVYIPMLDIYFNI